MFDEQVYIIDCDTGIDDALALGYAIASEPERLIGVTTVYGNVSVAQATRNTLDLLAILNSSSIPVHAGAATSLDGTFAGSSHSVHGSNGLGDAVLPPSSVAAADEAAPSYLCRMAHRHPGRLVVVTLGPLTNLALALSLDPTIAELIADVVVMGGAARHSGNATPAAEANFWHDPEAADRVLASGLPVQPVPLDATMRQRFTRPHQARLAAAPGVVPRFLAASLDRYFEFYEGVFGRSECALHDPLAVALALGDEAPLEEAATTLQVELGRGPARGTLVADLRPAYKGPVALEGALNRIVLETPADFASRLLAKLQTLP
jgi:purine nucleosidase